MQHGQDSGWKTLQHIHPKFSRLFTSLSIRPVSSSTRQSSLWLQKLALSGDLYLELGEGPTIHCHIIHMGGAKPRDHLPGRSRGEEKQKRTTSAPASDSALAEPLHLDRFDLYRSDKRRREKRASSDDVSDLWECSRGCYLPWIA